MLEKLINDLNPDPSGLHLTLLSETRSFRKGPAHDIDTMEAIIIVLFPSYHVRRNVDIWKFEQQETPLFNKKKLTEAVKTFVKGNIISDPGRCAENNREALSADACEGKKALRKRGHFSEIHENTTAATDE